MTVIPREGGERSIQYAAAESVITGSPAFAGDDGRNS